jgi:hypothetical protein
MNLLKIRRGTRHSNWERRITSEVRLLLNY